MENIDMYCKRKRNAKVELGLKWLIVSHTGLIVTMERDYDKCKKKKKEHGWMKWELSYALLLFSFNTNESRSVKTKSSIIGQFWWHHQRSMYRHGEINVWRSTASHAGLNCCWCVYLCPLVSQRAHEEIPDYEHYKLRLEQDIVCHK